MGLNPKQRLTRDIIYKYDIKHTAILSTRQLHIYKQTRFMNTVNISINFESLFENKDKNKTNPPEILSEYLEINNRFLAARQIEEVKGF